MGRGGGGKRTRQSAAGDKGKWQGSRRLVTKVVGNWRQAMTKVDCGKCNGGGGSSRAVEAKGSKLHC